MTSQLQFTLELENNKILDFLDLGTLRSKNKLDFIVYRKPVYTDTTIPHNLCHLTDKKFSALKFLFNRLRHINWRTMPIGKK
jgi:hypothetical protein